MSIKPSFSMIPIEKTDVYRTVFLRLTQLIEEHQLRPGQRLPSERELSERLGVSRTTVRQGIKVLESMGRVETRVGSGTFVTAENILCQYDLPDTAIDEKFLKNLCVAREGIEKTVFREFMKNHMTQKNLGELEALLARQEKEIASMREGVDVVYEFRFEQKVAELTLNGILAFQQKQIQKLWSYAWTQIGRVPEKRAVLHREHLLLLDAMRSGNLELLEERISDHVNKSVRASAFKKGGSLAHRESRREIGV